MTLKKVPLTSLNADTVEYDIKYADLDDCSGFPGLDNYRDEQQEAINFEMLCDAIIGSIGIQIALAKSLITSSNTNASISYICLDQTEAIDNQLIIINQLFGHTGNAYYPGKSLYAVCVSRPTPLAREAFWHIYNTNQLNKWVKLFYTEDFEGDCFAPALYEYLPDNSSTINVDVLKNDSFFKYMLFADPYDIEQSVIPISQYSLDEIGDIPYINELACSVGNLYILVTPDDENHNNYMKYLTWDHVTLK